MDAWTPTDPPQLLLQLDCFHPTAEERPEPAGPEARLKPVATATLMLHLYQLDAQQSGQTRQTGQYGQTGPTGQYGQCGQTGEAGVYKDLVPDWMDPPVQVFSLVTISFIWAGLD